MTYAWFLWCSLVAWLVYITFDFVPADFFAAKRDLKWAQAEIASDAIKLEAYEDELDEARDRVRIAGRKTVDIATVCARYRGALQTITTHKTISSLHAERALNPRPSHDTLPSFRTAVTLLPPSTGGES